MPTAISPFTIFGCFSSQFVSLMFLRSYCTKVFFLIFTVNVISNTCNQNTKMITKFIKAIILGPPGSGKGTISERIIKDFQMKHLSSGDLLRSHIRNQTVIGLEAKKYIKQGDLVPDEVMVELIADDLSKMSGVSWLLDGFPRTLAQAEALNNRHMVDVVLNLNVPFEVIINRIKGRWVHEPTGRIYHTEFNPPKVEGKDDETGEPLIQREDDKEHTVLARLKKYEDMTKPLIQYYGHLGVLEEFSGKYSNEIWPKVHKFLATKTEPLRYTHYD